LDHCVDFMKKMNTSLSTVVNSILNSITYILPINGLEKECYLVDCGDVEKVIEQGWKVRGVLLTHSHFDHIYGLNKLVEIFSEALVYTNQAGKEGLVNEKWNFSRYHTEVDNFIFSKMENVRVLEEGVQTLDGGLNVNVLFTPGHDPSCISYIIGNNLFTGDAYIPGIKTVTTLPKSNKEQAYESLARLQNLENKFGYTVCAGHPNKMNIETCQKER